MARQRLNGFPEDKKERKAAIYRAWLAAHHDERKAYWKRRAASMSPEEREYRRVQQIHYHQAHRDERNAAKRKWWNDNRLAIKVHRALNVPIDRARQLLEARP